MPEPFVFTAETNIEKALLLDDRVAEALVSLGLRCVDRREGPCVAAAVETFREAALYHEIPLERILSTLNALGIVPPPEPPPEGATAPPAAPPA